MSPPPLLPLEPAGSHAPPPLPPPAARPVWMPQIIVLSAAAVVYVVACCLPAVSLENQEVWHGGRLLALGWMGIFIGQVGWFANVGLLAAALFLLFRWHWVAFILAALSLLVGFQAFSLNQQLLPMDEAGVNHVRVASMGPATHVWLASIALVGIGALVLKLLPKKHV